MPAYRVREHNNIPGKQDQKNENKKTINRKIKIWNETRRKGFRKAARRKAYVPGTQEGQISAARTRQHEGEGDTGKSL